MAIIRKIIVAVDFSLHSRRILEYAAAIAERTGAEIVAVTVINQRLIDSVEKVFVSEGREFSLRRFLDDETYRRNQSLKDLLDESLPQKLSRRMVIKAGVPFEEILQAIDEEHPDLIVIAPKGRSDLEGYLFGTTSEKVFRHSPVPVLSLNVKV